MIGLMRADGGRQPLSVTIVGYLFVAAGAAGIAYHARDLSGPQFDAGAVWVLLLRLVAIVAGFFLLRGANWARVLALAWMAYHVVLSAFHSALELGVHLVFLTVISLMLLHPSAAAFFRPSSQDKRESAVR
jgi:hypothetical protein